MDVVQLATGKSHALALTRLGSVYSVGSNTFGQLGVSAVPDCTHTHTQVRKLDSRVCIAVAAGDDHSLALSDDGCVYAWGRNAEGACGIGSTSAAGARAANQPFPRFVAALHNVKIAKIACGGRHSLALAAGGELYAWGEGICGQLGLGKRVSLQDTPARVAIDASAVGSPDAGLLAARGNDGHMHADSKEMERDARASAPGFDVHVTEIAAGEAHTLARTRSGHVLAWGLNAKGQLGTRDLKSRFAPVLVRTETDEPVRATAIACGRNHSALLDASGALYTWGESADGRLGHSYLLSPAATAAGPCQNGAMPHVCGLVAALAEESMSSRDEQAPAAPRLPAKAKPVIGNDEQIHSDAATPANSDASAAIHSAAPAAVPGVTPVTWELDMRDTDSLQHRRVDALEHALRAVAAARGQSLAEVLYHAVHGGSSSADDIRTRIAEAFARTGILPPSASDAGSNLSTKELSLVAASLGIRMADLRKSTHPLAMPWLRTPIEQSTDVIVSTPKRVDHPVLDGRVLTHVACGPSETWCFAGEYARCSSAPGILVHRMCLRMNAACTLARVEPASGLDTGGGKLTLRGPGMAGLSRLPYVHAHAAQLRAKDAGAVEPRGFLTSLRPDATGMVAIPGVLVRFTELDKQPGKRPGDVAPEDVNFTGIHERGAARTFYSRAYFPPGWRIHEDGPDSSNNVLSRRADGSLHHGERGADTDCVVAVSPATPRPMCMKVEVLYTLPGTNSAAILEGDSATILLGGDAVLVLRGSVVYSTYALPTVHSVDPVILSASALRHGESNVTVTGENLFGLALLDAAAAQHAESLIDDVRAEVARREETELRAMSVASSSLLGKRPPSAGTSGSRPQSRRPSVTGDDPAASVAPTLHMTRAAGGSQRPNHVHVRFSIIQSGKVLGSSESVRGWYELAYDEALVHVGGAVDAMTGTTAAAGNARTAVSVATGLNAGGIAASRSRSHFAGTSTGLGNDDEDEDDDDADEEGVIGRYSAKVTCVMPALALPGDISALLPNIPAAIQDVYDAMRTGQLQPSALLRSSNETSDAVGIVTPRLSDVVAEPHTAPPAHGVDAAAVYDFEAALSAQDAASADVLLRPEISANGRDFIPAVSTALIKTYAPAFSHVSPPCGPAAGGYEVQLRGAGFLPSSTLLARFVPVRADGAAEPADGAVTVPAEFVDATTIAVIVPKLQLLPAPAPVPVVDAPVSLSPTQEAQTAAPAPATGRQSPTKPVASSARRSSTSKEAATTAAAPAATPAVTVNASSVVEPVAPGGGSSSRSTAGRADTQPCGYSTYRVQLSVDGVTFDSSPTLMFVAFDGRVEGTTPSLVGLGGGAVQLQLERATTETNDALTNAEWHHSATTQHWMPPVATIGHPRFRLGPLVSARLWNEVALLENVPVSVDAHTNAVMVALPPLAELCAAGGWTPPAQGSSPTTGGASPRAAAAAGVAPSAPPPALRACSLQLVVAGHVLDQVTALRYYDPTSLAVTTVGPKKIALGGEIVVAVDGLDALVAGKDGLGDKKPAGARQPAAPSPAVPQSPATGAPLPSSTRSWQDASVPAPGLLKPRIRITGGGASVVLPGKVDGSSNISALLPASGLTEGAPGCSPAGVSIPIGDVTVDVCLDGCNFLPHPAVAAKIAKK